MPTATLTASSSNLRPQEERLVTPIANPHYGEQLQPKMRHDAKWTIDFSRPENEQSLHLSCHKITALWVKDPGKDRKQGTKKIGYYYYLLYCVYYYYFFFFLFFFCPRYLHSRGLKTYAK